MCEPAPSVVWNGAIVHILLNSLSASSLLFPTRSCWRLQTDLTLPIGTCNWIRRRSKWSWVTSEHGSNWRRLLQTGRGPWRYPSMPGFGISSCDFCVTYKHKCFVSWCYHNVRLYSPDEMEAKAGRDHCHWGILEYCETDFRACVQHWPSMVNLADWMLLPQVCCWSMMTLEKKTFLSSCYSMKLTVTRNSWLGSKSWRRGNLRRRRTWRRKEMQTVLSGRTWRPWTRNWRTVTGDWAPLTR